MSRILRSLPSAAARRPLCGARSFAAASEGPDHLETDIINKVVVNKVVVFSKSHCPFCRKVKQLFADLKQPVHVVELDQTRHGADIQKALEAMTAQRTVPNVFVNGKHVGGCDATVAALEDGRLKAMLE